MLRKTKYIQEQLRCEEESYETPSVCLIKSARNEKLEHGALFRTLLKFVAFFFLFCNAILLGAFSFLKMFLLQLCFF